MSLISDQACKHQARIMIVDDNIANLKLLEDMLVQKGHQVRSFPLGRLALASAIKNPPDLILLDIDMPEMTGYEVCQRLKSIDALAGIPVVFLSASNETRDQVKAFRVGATDYISKPFQFDEVHARVEVHLNLHHLQRELARQNEHLEDTVASRTSELAEANKQLKASVREKELLLQEVHHRVNNNLQLICSLLGMQCGSADDPALALALRESQNRVMSMATVHLMLYDSASLISIDFAAYTQTLADAVASSYGIDTSPVQLAFELDPVCLEIDQAIPGGLILNELLSNAFKHAFPGGRAGEVRISLKRRDGCIRLAVEDNGVGLPDPGISGKRKSLGMSIVKTLSQQLGGTLETTSNRGLQSVLTFTQTARKTSQ